MPQSVVTTEQQSVMTWCRTRNRCAQVYVFEPECKNLPEQITVSIPRSHSIEPVQYSCIKSTVSNNVAAVLWPVDPEESVVCISKGLSKDEKSFIFRVPSVRQ